MVGTPNALGRRGQKVLCRPEMTDAYFLRVLLSDVNATAEMIKQRPDTSLTRLGVFNISGTLPDP